MSDLTLRQLRYLSALADTRHFRKAAEREGISQPSLSVQISNLEDTLALRLVERGRGPVTLTPAGREVLLRAQAILDDVQRLRDTSSTLKSGLSGTLRLGVSPTLGPYLMPYVVAELHRAYPDLSLYIREHTPADLRHELERGGHDILLTQLPVTGADLTTRRLFREPLSLVTASDHPLAARAQITEADLQGQAILSLGPGYALHDQIAGLCADTGAELQRDYEGTSLDALRQMVGMGMGATFLPALYIASEIPDADPSLAIRPMKRPALHRSVGLVWRKRSGNLTAFDRIADAITRVAKDRFTRLIAIETD
ncbi:hydrogen peroxide-inducible genes activator [Cognatishimia sp. MH4019]|uniref:hydrogen peroxide-inducible genes activator n=1 Tax=Cognatishimia sp. MH4019 TaxID=2854030 RepID=UPI001CD491AA|nr:hydrogen peroxide-inducible genes activator [Cognatishimia sp. MH4019]